MGVGNGMGSGGGNERGRASGIGKLAPRHGCGGELKPVLCDLPQNG